jgi:UDP-N-acetylglucosamine--N-acetylmuramyl-(pentapeptide) pyrophosphoryl-undecaprenol N-acetylglucosamine transferase
MKALRIIISGGGTGGHIYPAIAIANEIRLRNPHAEILFVGAADRMEMEKVPQAGYDIKGLWISGLDRKLSLKNLLFPFKVMSSLWRSRKIIKQFKPDIAIGTGGFASGPLLKMASLKGLPTLIQEQNSYPGITNKLLAKGAHRICVAYDGLERFFPKEKIVLTGNPVRQDLLDVSSKRAAAHSYFNVDPSKTTLLILGGSLGARRINELIAKELEFLLENSIQVIWQTGKLYCDTYKHLAANTGVQIHAFLNRMDLAYAASDIVISRAGASSVSELCIVGKPTIFIPSPNVAEDHQTKNAQAIVSKNAGILLKECDLDHFQTIFLRLLNDPEQQQALSEGIKKLARIAATTVIVDEIEKLANT